MSGRLGFVATVVEACRQSLARVLRPRLLVLACLAACALAAAAFVLAGRAHERLDGRSLYCVLFWWLGATVLMPWTTLHMGVETVHGPIEDRTLLYTLLRPVPRAALFLGQWLAVSIVGSALSILGVVALFVGVALRPDLWGDGVEVPLLGVAALVMVSGAFAYAAVATWFGAFFRRPLAWGAFFVVGLQVLTANLPVSAGLRQLTITDPLRRLVLDGVNPDQRLARQLWPAEREFQPDLIGEPMRDLAVLTAVCLLLGLWSYTRTEYDARNRE